MKQVALIAKLKNNRLYERRVAAGLSGAAVARGAGISNTDYCALESLRVSPRCKGGGGRRQAGELTSCAVALCKFWGCSADELFPVELEQINGAPREIKADVHELRVLASQLHMAVLGPGEALEHKELLALAEQSLKPRELAIFSGVMDGVTLEELGRDHGISRERARQIARRAGAVVMRKAGLQENQ